MILTVCLSPCTDITIELDSLNVGKTNIVKSKTLSFTGKALNVAIGVARLGGEPYATGLMYNENGYMFENVKGYAEIWETKPVLDDNGQPKVDEKGNTVEEPVNPDAKLAVEAKDDKTLVVTLTNERASCFSHLLSGT